MRSDPQVIAELYAGKVKVEPRLNGPQKKPFPKHRKRIGITQTAKGTLSNPVSFSRPIVTQPSKIGHRRKGSQVFKVAGYPGISRASSSSSVPSIGVLLDIAAEGETPNTLL